ncbi:MAG TPA: metal-sulfur cluster assembly factor [Micromonosporaceae bacterium]|nr:metal-sulfur cluster assembly factor [Micromonosporaceae bacterium]
MSGMPGDVRAALSEVFDPCCRELGISVVEMGLIHSVTVEDRRARIDLLLTTGWCPFAVRLLDEIKERVAGLPGIDTADVEIVWNPAWTTDRLSPAARAKLQFLPNPNQVADRDAYLSNLEEHQP